ncbi:UNVERIFIED_CONTAM: hypothetical protein FKN15_074624 [Acipenser sinensis]
MVPRPQNLPAFPDFMEEVRSSWDRPDSGPSMLASFLMLIRSRYLTHLYPQDIPLGQLCRRSYRDPTVMRGVPAGGCVAPSPHFRVGQVEPLVSSSDADCHQNSSTRTGIAYRAHQEQTTEPNRQAEGMQDVASPHTSVTGGVFRASALNSCSVE